MNAYEFLLTLGFWQWLGLIMLATAIFGGLGAAIGSAIHRNDKP